jgi:hypothetical protein
MQYITCVSLNGYRTLTFREVSRAGIATTYLIARHLSIYEGWPNGRDAGLSLRRLARGLCAAS